MIDSTNQLTKIVSIKCLTEVEKMNSLYQKKENEKCIFFSISKSEIKFVLSEDDKLYVIKWLQIRTSKELKHRLQHLLSGCNLKVVHDFKEVLKILRKKKMNITGPVFDVMIASQLLHSEKTSGHQLNEIYNAYSHSDCSDDIPDIIKLKKIYRHIASLLEKEGLDYVFRLEMDCVYPVADMEINGFAFNKNAAYYIDDAIVKGYLKHVNSNTDRIYPVYAQLGTVTGRITCSKPNLQGVSRKDSVRSLFTAPPEKRLIIADYNQIELRIIAEISGDSKMIEAFQLGEDIHRYTASLFLNKPVEKVTSDERTTIKAINFGIVYGMGAKSLAEYVNKKYGLSLTIGEAKEFKEQFYKNFSGILKWIKGIYQRDRSMIYTSSGRKRILDKDKIYTQTINSPIQCTSADILKEALCLIYREIHDSDTLIVTSIHDEIILETPIDQAEIIKEKLIRAMVAGGERYLKKVPVIVLATIAETWAEK
jgi:DNA polymerase I-like protein with 3'-5' exonuclease and polymerase domains